MTHMTEQATTKADPRLLGSVLGYQACQDDNWLWATLNIADMVGPITHELHNVLNNIVLQAAIVMREVPEAFREDVAAVRRHAFRPAACSASWMPTGTASLCLSGQWTWENSCAKSSNRPGDRG